MLPKEEKIIKKKSSEGDQPGLFDKEDERKRLKNKRRFVYIAMALTVGLSISFWAYRSLKNFNFSSFKLPKLNLTINYSSSSKSINLPKDGSSWSIFLKRLDTDTVVYQTNQENIFSTQSLDSFLIKIDQTGFTNSSSYSSTLPQGLKIKEIIEENNSAFSYFSKIVTPSQELLLIINITNSPDLNKAKNLIPDLINQLYWYYLQK